MGELSFTLRSPMELFTSLGGRPEYRVLAFLPATLCKVAQGVPFPEALRAALEEDRADWHPQDIQPLLEMSSVLGATDLNGQLSALSLIQRRLEEEREAAANLLESHSKLYQTLGFSAGAAIVLLLL